MFSHRNNNFAAKIIPIFIPICGYDMIINHFINIQLHPLKHNVNFVQSMVINVRIGHMLKTKINPNEYVEIIIKKHPNHYHNYHNNQIHQIHPIHLILIMNIMIAMNIINTKNIIHVKEIKKYNHLLMVVYMILIIIQIEKRKRSQSVNGHLNVNDTPPQV